MSLRYTSRIALPLVAAALALQACATKGFVQREVAFERNARIAADSGLSARIDAMEARIIALRTDLDSLRTQFNVAITTVEDGLQFALPVTFDFDDATVRMDARPMLERFARIASRYYPSSTITIEGFADPAGTSAYNVELSRRRAENVRMALESLGLSGAALRAIGYGETRLVTPAEKDQPGAEANRRVVFVIESAGQEAAIALGPST